MTTKLDPLHYQPVASDPVTMTCRRCGTKIVATDINLIDRDISDRHDYGLPIIGQSIIVCDFCITDNELTKLHRLRTYKFKPPPPVRMKLTDGEYAVLLAVSQRRVYRQPMQIRIMGGDTPATNDRSCYKIAYMLRREGFCDWTPTPGLEGVSKKDRPIVWMEVTTDGLQQLDYEKRRRAASKKR